MADDFETDLEAQLASQKEALASIEIAISACGIDSAGAGGHEELLQMQTELRAAVSELESALLEIKRARILQQLAASAAPNSHATTGESEPTALTAPPAATTATLPPETTATSGASTSALAGPGTLCHFRYMDGRWYSGRVHGPGRQAGTVSVSFEVATRPFMLDLVDVMEALVRPLQGSSSAAAATGQRSSAAPPPSSQQHPRVQGPQQLSRGAAAAAAGTVHDAVQYDGLAVGRRALALLPGCRLYVPVEVVALDTAKAVATVLPLLQTPQSGDDRGRGGCGAGGEVVVPLARVTRHAHVPAAEVAGTESAAVAAVGRGGGGGNGGGGAGGGYEPDSDGDAGGSSSSVSAFLRTGLGGAGSESDGSESDDEYSDGSADDGDDEEGDVDMYGSDRGDSDVEGGDVEDEGDDGLDVFGHARQAAATGALDDSAMFADWEAHSRGVASRLLTRMGYVRGRGLGSRGQGTMAAPEVLLLPERRGLGAVDRDRVRRVGGPAGDKLAVGVAKKRRKRGGARQKRKKAIVAAREARREAREQEEGAPGGGGLFDFINSSLGDSSVAARIRKAQVAVAGVGVGPGGAAAAVTAGAAAIAGAAASAAGGAPRAAPDRRGLMSHHDTVAGIQTKLGRLQEMLGRNRENRGLRTQIEAQIRSVKAELADAQSAAARASKAIHDKDAQKKWLKF